MTVASNQNPISARHVVSGSMLLIFQHMEYVGEEDMPLLRRGLTALAALAARGLIDPDAARDAKKALAQVLDDLRSRGGL